MARKNKQNARRGRRLSIPERNVAAEVRHVETGRRAYVQRGGWVKVLSDTHGDLGKHYRVEYVGHTDGLISFDCRPQGPKAYLDDHLATSSQPGVTPCMHAAAAARRLEREGLAEHDVHGRWRLPPSKLAELLARLDEHAPANPLEGLPR